MLHGACNLRLCPIHVTRPLTITQQLNKPRLTVTYVQNSPTQCTCSLVHLLTLSLAHSLTPPIPRTLASSHLRSPPPFSLPLISDGQTALSFAAQNGRIDVVLALLAARGADGRPDLAALGNQGLTAGQVAQQANHPGLANLLAEADRERQVSAVFAAMTDGAPMQRAFDSLGERLIALFGATGLAPPQLAVDDEPDFDFDGDDDANVCIVCMDAPVQAALKPCWHAQYCVQCAGRVHRDLGECGVCRGRTTGVQRIFLP